MGRPGSLVVLDVHGDLAPAILNRLTPQGRRRVVAVDASLPPVPGIAALVAAGSHDRAAAHLVAALKRLSPDGTDLYWGFRLERIFDTFVRLAFESGGSLTDLYDLLTNPDRRDAARLATRTPELGRFLDELAPVVRRNPEFLWSAATRLSKVALVPALRELLAPEDEGLAVETLLEQGRSLLVRLPFASLGPESSSFAATLVLGRVYFGVAAAAERRGHPVHVAVLLDEVHAFSPRLVAEILTEGRKFGLSTVVATQYPDRLSHEVQSAARGALRGFVAFRVPRPSAREVGAWLGLRPEEAEEILPSLPTGEGLVLDSFSDGVRSAPPEETAYALDPTAWSAAIEATRREFAVVGRSSAEGTEGDALTERLLLAVLSKVELGVRVRRDELVAVATALPGDRSDPALLSDRLVTLEREGYVVPEGDGLRLTAAGERRSGTHGPDRRDPGDRGAPGAADRDLPAVRPSGFPTRDPPAGAVRYDASGCSFPTAPRPEHDPCPVRARGRYRASAPWMGVALLWGPGRPRGGRGIGRSARRTNSPRRPKGSPPGRLRSLRRRRSSPGPSRAIRPRYPGFGDRPGPGLDAPPSARYDGATLENESVSARVPWARPCGRSSRSRFRSPPVNPTGQARPSTSPCGSSGRSRTKGSV